MFYSCYLKQSLRSSSGLYAKHMGLNDVFHVFNTSLSFRHMQNDTPKLSQRTRKRYNYHMPNVQACSHVPAGSSQENLINIATDCCISNTDLDVHIPQYMCRVWIKCITIVNCDLFFHYCNAKEISFYYFCDTKICAKHTKKGVNFIYIVGIKFVR